MKKIIILFLLFPLLFVSTQIKASFKVNAPMYVVYEATTNTIIDGQNYETVSLTASICKILTCITAIEHGSLDKWCEVTNEVSNQIGSSIYLKKNDKIKLIDALYGLMLRSGNDCAYLIALNVGGYVHFIKLMNEMAKKIGMTSSTFTNPSGLDEETKNFSTCLDMAKLIGYCSNNEIYCKINSSIHYSFTSFNGVNYNLSNKHKLIGQYCDDYDLILGKTGYTQKAKRTLVTLVKEKNAKIVVVTFKGTNDFNDHINCIKNFFENYTKIDIIKSQIIDTSSDYPYICYLKNDVSIYLKENQKKDVTVRVRLYRGDVEEICGEVHLYLNGRKIKEEYLYRYY